MATHLTYMRDVIDSIGIENGGTFIVEELNRDTGETFFHGPFLSRDIAEDYSARLSAAGIKIYFMNAPD